MSIESKAEEFRRLIQEDMEKFVAKCNGEQAEQFKELEKLERKLSRKVAKAAQQLSQAEGLIANANELFKRVERLTVRLETVETRMERWIARRAEGADWPRCARCGVSIEYDRVQVGESGELLEWQEHELCEYCDEVTWL